MMDGISRELDDFTVYMHALGLESSFSSTKYCRYFKHFINGDISREELEELIPSPSDKYWSMAAKEIENANSLGILCISIIDDEYPKALSEIEDPPLVIFVNSANPNIKDLLSINTLFAIVGSRKITPYGVSVTRKLSSALSNSGFTIVSGLAYGVDKCAHEGSLDASDNSFPTISVLGSGLLEIYPSLHKKLAYEIIDSGGAIISEYGLNKTPRAYLFPRRNRIISGLSFAVLVVEAEEKSGSLITARLAMEQGRDVYAIPGSIDAPCSAGCNRIISEGAMSVRSVDNLFELLSSKFPELISTKKSTKKRSKLLSQIKVISNKEVKHKTEKKIETILKTSSLNKEEILLIEKLREGHNTYDSLLELGLFDTPKLHNLLINLQMNDFIQEINGNYVLIK